MVSIVSISKRRPLTRSRAKEGVWTTVGLSGLLTIIAEAANVHGWLWQSIRVSVSVLFVLYVLAWLESIRNERSSRDGSPR
jgi:hypothetical protein